MRFVRQLSAAAVAMCLMAASTMALTIGDPAPAIKVSKWVKGDAVPSFEKGKIYVVEFWATWCGPCKVSIPHLTKMAHDFKDVTFIGTSVWEREDGKVEPFVQQMGDKMDYHVATDDKSSVEKGAMAETWMEAAQQGGIPTAFIVGKDSTILWIGHPMEMEPVLKKVVDNTYDMAAAKQAMIKEQEAQAVMKKLNAELNAALTPPMQKQDYAGALTALDGLIAKHPEAREQLMGVKMNIAARGKQWDAFYSAMDEVAAAESKNPQKLNELAWGLVSNKTLEKPDYDRAQKYAERAVELTKREDSQILDTLAHAYFKKGDKAKAIAVEEEAIAKTPEGDLKKELTSTLDEFKAAK